MTTAAPEYDRIARWYDEAVQAGSLLHELAIGSLLALASDVRGLKVCDLACGQGAASREFARRGASVVGVDISLGMLQLARLHDEGEHLDIAYVLDDAQGLHALASASFDGIVSNLALMDIAVLSLALRSAARVLRPGAWLVFSITHPCFQTPASSWVSHADGGAAREVAGYFQEGRWFSTNPTGVRGQVGAYHRTLGTYVTALIGAGFSLEGLNEPRAAGRLAEQWPGDQEVPSLLCARWRKVAS